MNGINTDHGEWVRTTVAFSAFLLGAAILAAHLFFLQFDPQVGQYYREAVRSRWESYECPIGRRGNILFRDGSVIACNRKVARVLVDPIAVKNVDAVAAVLARHLLEPAARLAGAIRSHRGRGVTLADGIPIETALAIDRENLQGVFTFFDYQRFYPQSSFAAAASVGYAGPQPAHRTGLEYSFDEQLSGRNGRISYRKDARRKRLPGSVVSEEPKLDGQDLTTTLDQAMQLICEDELRRAVADNRADWSCILVLDPRSGEVLAAATDPTFDPNEYARGNIGDEYNVLIHRVIEPGSTVKPLLAAYAIEREWLDAGRRFVCARQLVVGGQPIREAELNHVLGDARGVPVREVIVNSSNIGMAQVAMALGQDRVLASYKAVGFFQRTGIELPRESAGFEPYYYSQSGSGRRSTWPKRVLATTGFGQGMSVTPLQLARAYCVIANGGFLVRPTLAKVPGDPQQVAGASTAPALPTGEILLTDERPAGDEILRRMGAEAMRGTRGDEVARIRVLSAATCELITDWLVGVISTGTGKRARLSRHSAAGKTGTGQVPSASGGYREGVYSASFVGFFPARTPRYVVLVVFVHPKTGEYYGGEVAAPVFKAVCDRISYLDHGVAEEGGDAS